MERAKAAVADTTLDPEAARFRNLRARVKASGPLASNDQAVQKWYVCGEVNAKNAFGGYVGYRRFRYADATNPSFGPFVTIRDPSEFKAELDPEIWDAYEKVECDGADREIAVNLQNRQAEAWLKESTENLRQAQEEYRSSNGE